MGANQAEFGELVTLLSRAAPAELDALRRQFPNAHAELREGGVLGDASPQLGCAVAGAALAKYSDAARALLPKLRSRLAWSGRFDLAAKFTATCGSGGTVGILATGAEADKAVLTAIAALIGSLCSLLFAYLQRDESAGSIPEIYNKLLSAIVDADEIQRALPIVCSGTATDERDKAIIAANETAKTLNQIAMRFA